ncbi:hypothetical protein KC19_8G077300 [Ceratodon purpureus]|uniref:Uncharacterized protein n=1 Tax=Ceratodon purpureus TaxID=3225 RepID=A0A8T0GYB5_CERPU|nr:hypothetical protein KC19_8G077300 [Ceratodon purpureus]
MGTWSVMGASTLFCCAQARSILFGIINLDEQSIDNGSTLFYPYHKYSSLNNQVISTCIS